MDSEDGAQEQDQAHDHDDDGHRVDEEAKRLVL